MQSTRVKFVLLYLQYPSTVPVPVCFYRLLSVTSCSFAIFVVSSEGVRDVEAEVPRI